MFSNVNMMVYFKKYMTFIGLPVKVKVLLVSFNCYFMLSQQEICFLTYQVGMMFYMFRAPTT